MDQNNYNQPPVYQQPPYQQPVYMQPVVPAPTRIPIVEECADNAFSKGLAATIMAGFPIASIIAIVMGSKGLDLVEEAEAIAAQYGVSAGGKAIAAKVLGKIGKICGIVMTAFWSVYLLLYIWLIALITSNI